MLNNFEKKIFGVTNKEGRLGRNVLHFLDRIQPWLRVW